MFPKSKKIMSNPMSSTSATYHCDQSPFPVNPLAPPPWSVAGLGSTHCGHQNGNVGKSGGLEGCSTRSRHLNNFFPFFSSLQFKGNLKHSGVHRSIQVISIDSFQSMRILVAVSQPDIAFAWLKEVVRFRAEG